MIVIIDNYDSFTYNLYQYIGETGSDVRVFRNDEIAASDISSINPSRIILSPGPGHPSESGVCPEIIVQYGEKIPILGVCLGHQAIAYAFGGAICRANNLFHGKTSCIRHDTQTIFSGIENPFTATRYHSLVVDGGTIPECLLISAETDDGTIMGIRHKKFPIEGVQFHPESIMTTQGKNILRNFLDYYG